MPLIHNYHDFIAQSGMLTSDVPFQAIAIVPCNHFGVFWPSRAPELLAFCRANSDYHIMSQLGPAVTLNRFTAGATMYFLAAGDANPHIIYDTNATSEDSEIFELWAAHAAA